MRNRVSPLARDALQAAVTLPFARAEGDRNQLSWSGNGGARPTPPFCRRDAPDSRIAHERQRPVRRQRASSARARWAAASHVLCQRRHPVTLLDDAGSAGPRHGDDAKKPGARSRAAASRRNNSSSAYGSSPLPGLCRARQRRSGHRAVFENMALKKYSPSSMPSCAGAPSSAPMPRPSTSTRAAVTQRPDVVGLHFQPGQRDLCSKSSTQSTPRPMYWSPPSKPRNGSGKPES